MDVTQLAPIAPKSGRALPNAGNGPDETGFSETFDEVTARGTGAQASKDDPNGGEATETPETSDKEMSDLLAMPTEGTPKLAVERKVPETKRYAFLPELKLVADANREPKGEEVLLPEETLGAAQVKGPDRAVLRATEPMEEATPPGALVEMAKTSVPTAQAAEADRARLTPAPQIEAVPKRGETDTQSDNPLPMGRQATDPQRTVAATAQPVLTASIDPIPDAPAKGPVFGTVDEAVMADGDALDLAKTTTERREVPQVSDPVRAPILAEATRPSAPRENEKASREAPNIAEDLPSEVDIVETTPDAPSTETTQAPKPPTTTVAPPVTPVLVPDPAVLQTDAGVDPMSVEVSGSDPIRSDAARSVGVAPQIFHRPETPRMIAQQVADVIRTTRDGTLEVTLRPEELGRLSLTFNGDGSTLSVSLSADRPETLDLLRRNLTLLEQDLRDLGYSALNFAFEGGDGQGKDTEAPPDPRAEPRSLQVTETAQDLISPSPTNATGGGIDLRL
ncbi:MAG: flagellar hook-length control protein FliK [Pseudomonadota bacterium]|nr:flagellar hook-length control protein FliK [Pseudomonadota bacterium]